MTDATSPAATAVRAIAGSIVRHAITAGGVWLVRKGMLDQQTATDAGGAIADYVAGGGLALLAVGWGALRARAAHWRWVRAWMAPAQPLPPA